MKRDYKYVVFDLDGTLLNDDKKISCENENAIYKLRQNGIHIIIATGRKFRDVTKYLCQLNMKEKDYFICEDGGSVRDYKGDIIFQNKALLMSDLGYIVSLGKMDLSIITEFTDYYYTSSYLKKVIFSFVFRYLPKFQNTRFISNIKDIPQNVKVEKIRTRKLPEQYVISKMKKRYCVHKVFHKYLDITSKGTNKFFAIEFLVHYRNICNCDDILYFGDDINDIECFRNLANTVAMKNATKEVKDIAKYIIGTNQTNEISTFIDDLLE